MSWALVTGGSGAIGAAVAVRLAAAGHDVALHTFRDLEGAEAVAGKVRAEGREALVVRAHLGKDGAAAALAEEVGDRHRRGGGPRLQRRLGRAAARSPSSPSGTSTGRWTSTRGRCSA